MSLKVKLITSISAFFLVLALLVTGVFAARNLEFSFGGTINFEGVNGNVDALVTAEVTGTATPITLDDISIEQGDTEVAVPESWQNLDLTLAEDHETAVILFSFTNRREDRALKVTIEVNAHDAYGSVIGLAAYNVTSGWRESTSTDASIYSTELAPNTNKTSQYFFRATDKFKPVDNIKLTFNVSFQDMDV